MNFFSYIQRNLQELGILDIEEIIALPLSTYTRPDNTIEYDIVNDDNSLLDNYSYIWSGYVENYGIDILRKLDGSFKMSSYCYNDIYLEKNINGSWINEPEIEIKNIVKYLNTDFNFKGTYNGDYCAMNIIDFDWSFYVILNLRVIKSDNYYFNKYSNSFGKLLDCIDYLSEERLEISFNCAYTALELLIKQVKNIDYLTPSKTKSILIDSGFDKDKAETIRVDRNDNIHPSEYGFFEDEEEMQISLKHTFEAYFYFFNKYCG
ncbi:hypothetical protein [Clostridium perfringens]|uniref:hypothetical protein n=1 Tax=Clostridium perfringens TaxID=1502 RepID=UPI0039E87271